MVVSKLLKSKIGIYKLTIGKHSYVGSSINLYNRLMRHFNALKSGKHNNTYLQRCVNKYGIENLRYTILEICSINISYSDLLVKEKFHIENENSDLNLKLDPVTQQNCKTVIIPVYQFDAFGKLIKKWPSLTAAAKFYNVNMSNIVVACRRPERQKYVKGYLWSYSPKYPYKLDVIYVFDLTGKLLSKHSNTVSIYEKYFSYLNRKTVLSQLKKKIDSNSTYKNYFLSSKKDFVPAKKVDLDILTEFEKIKELNPLLITVNERGEVLTKQRFNSYKNKYRKFLLLIKSSNYQLKDVITTKVNSPNKCKTIKVIDKTTGEEKIYSSITEACKSTFGIYDSSLYRNCVKHIKRGTPYKGYLFTRDLL